MADSFTVPSMGSWAMMGVSALNSTIQNNLWKAKGLIYYGKGMVHWKYVIPLMIVMIIILYP